ncbi:gamma-glutamylcyclotransferase family protein [Roseibium sp.]|uniref:gamma-glutamylcyclotransferase family protein n=1 Tax=Roseibium sp. TaxID=1936156 RepID=UPI0039F02D67
MAPSHGNPLIRLATYGTLAPGRPNHHQVADIKGVWSTGTIRGHLTKVGWGTALGFPGFVPDPDGDALEVHVLTSVELEHHWDRLDAFEGVEYRRETILVETTAGHVAAFIYVVEEEKET